jgi:hypothetical protein
MGTLSEGPEGFYGLEESEVEKRRRGRSLGKFYGLDSPALDRWRGDALQRPGGPGNLRLLYHCVHKGSPDAGTGMLYMVLKKKHPQGYRELGAEAQGQRELL